jgi:hypothetical protein
MKSDGDEAHIFLKWLLSFAMCTLDRLSVSKLPNIYLHALDVLCWYLLWQISTEELMELLEQRNCAFRSIFCPCSFHLPQKYDVAAA